MEKWFKEALAINESMESKLEISNALLLLPSSLPPKFYYQVVRGEQQKYGSWYNYSSIYEESIQEGNPATVLLWLFGGIGGVILFYLIKHRDEILPLLLQHLDRIKNLLQRKGIASEQSFFIRETFGRIRPCIYSIVGSDQLRPSRGAKAPADKFGKAEELQLDEFGKDLMQNLVSRTIFAERQPVQIRDDKKNSQYRINNANVHSSGGPVPNLFTGNLLAQINQVKFDLTNGLYPLKTKSYPNGLVPDYDSKEKIYHSDYGVILWAKKNPFNVAFSCLSTFGCHAWGTVAATRAITDFGSDVIKVDDNILKNMVSVIKKGVERFYVVVQAKLGWIEGNWDITEIHLCEGPVEI